MTSVATTSACPLCGAQTRIVYRHPDVQLRRCKGCDHCFADLSTLAERAVYDESYGDEDHKNWFENPNTGLFDRIQGHLESVDARSVIDLGCGRADFLSHLAPTHPDWQLVGIEQTPFDPPVGVEVITGDLLTAEIDRQFDGVVSLAVIEHVEDTAAFLRRAIDLVRPGGAVVVMTLNDRSVLYATARLLRAAGIPGPFDQLYSRHHLHHFNKSSLRTAVEASGLTIVDRLDHNIPAAAIDFPSSGWLADSIRLNGARATFALGALTRRCYLQTLFCQAPAIV